MTPLKLTTLATALLIVSLPAMTARAEDAGASNHGKSAQQSARVKKLLGVRDEAPSISFFDVTGALDAKSARATVETQLGAIDRCYKQRQKTDSISGGEMVFRLLVSGKGSVIGTTVVRSSVGDDELERCARLEAMDLRFTPSPSKGHSTVNYTLSFGTPGILGLLKSISPSTGGLGVIGSGGSGGSGGAGGLGAITTSGVAPSTTSSSPPTITQGTASVRGSLSKQVIRSHIQSDINQIRFCYEQQLAQNPNLTGRVSVRFVISQSGQVSAAAVAGSTISNTDVEQCVVRAIQRISFPQPSGGGVVIVTYPFFFQPGP